MPLSTIAPGSPTVRSPDSLAAALLAVARNAGDADDLAAVPRTMSDKSVPNDHRR
jgi:hypothetical protein